MTDSIAEITGELIRWVDDHGWRDFHSPREIVLGLVVEAVELLEHFQWLTDHQGVDAYLADHTEEIGDELADVAAYLFEGAAVMGIDLLEALRSKITKNSLKYPL